MAIPEARSTERTKARARAPDSAMRSWLPPRDGWIAVAGVGLIYAAHLYYGALINDAAMMVNIAAALLLTGVLSSPRLREDLLRLKGLALPAVLFALVILIALWTLTPWTPGGPHPVWGYVGVGPPASTIDKSATTMEIIKLLGLGCIFLVGAAVGGRDNRARYAVQVTIAAGVVFGLWALIDAATTATYDGGGRRLQANFLNANTAGTVFAALLMLACGELLRRLRSTARERRLQASLLPAAAVLSLAVCLLDTASRGAVAAFLVGLIGFVGLQIRAGRLKFSRTLLAVAGITVVLLVVVALAGDVLVERLFGSGGDAASRVATWRYHWQAFLLSPLFGYGLGTAETINKTLLSMQTYRDLWLIRAPLNVYLQWLEEAGLIGATPMFLCIGAVIVQTARGQARRSRMTGLIASLLAVDVIFLLHGATDFGLEVTSVATFWAWLLGLQFSLAQGSSRR